MADLNIKITADAQPAVVGLNKVTKSTSSLLNKLVETGKGADDFGNALNRDLAVAADKAGYSVKGLQAQLKVLMQYQERVRQGLGETSGEYKAFKDAISLINDEISKQEAVLDGAATATKKYTDVTAEASKETKNYGAKLVSIASNILKFQLLMGPITALVRGVKNTIKESITVSAEAEQTFNKLATVFDSVAESANNAASSISSLVGVAKSTAAGALSTVGDLLQAQGMGQSESLATASSWVSQFYDIINFKDLNMDLGEFAQNFMSGAAGNLRNFRTFGSIVKESAVNARLASEGLDKLTGSQLELAKMTTRANMALEQQANAMGATEREWDSTLAVNRRLSEAWKEYKENLGDTINKVLKPLKEAWTEVLDQINKAKKAQEEFNNGNVNPGVYDMPNSAADRAAFTRRLSALTMGGQSPLATVSNFEDVDSTQALMLKELRAIFIEFGATVADVSNLMGDNLSDAIYEYLTELDAERAAVKKRQEEIDARKAEIEAASDSYDAFIETILNLAGVSGITASSFGSGDSRFTQSDNGPAFLKQQIANAVRESGIEAFNSIEASDLSEFVSAIDIALGEVDESGMVAAKAETIKALYTTLFNKFVQDKTLEENADLLEKIANYYKELTSEVVQSTGVVASMQQMGAGYDVQLAQVGMTDEQKALDNLRREYESLKAKALPEEIADLDAAYEEAERTLLALYNAQKKYDDGLEDEAKEKERIAEYENAIKSINKSMTDYANQIGQIGMTEEEKALDDLRIAFEQQLAELDLTQEEEDNLTQLYEKQRSGLIELQSEQAKYNTLLESQAANLKALENVQKQIDSHATSAANYRTQLAMVGMSSADQTRYKLGLQADEALNSGDLDLYKAIVDEIRAFNELQTATDALTASQKAADEELKRQKAWSDLNKSANPFQGVIDTYNSGKDASGGKVGGGIWALLIELLKNTETFKTLVDLFKNTFVPILDAILKPLLPVLKMFASFFDNLDWELAFDIMKVIAEILAGTLYIIKAAINTIEAVVKTIFYAITFQWGKLDKVWANYTDTMEQDTATMVKTLAAIKDTNFMIARNTENNDLKLLEDLWKRGIIDSQTYYKEAGSIQGTYVPGRVEPAYPSYVSHAPSNSSVTIGTITINAPNGDINEIIRGLVRAGIPLDTSGVAIA